MTTQTTGVQAALDHLDSQVEAHLRELDDFLRIESVSADPARVGEVRHAAQWIMLELATIGFEHVAIDGDLTFAERFEVDRRAQ